MIPLIKGSSVGLPVMSKKGCAMKVLLAAAALLLSTAYNANANTTLTGVITIYDQTSGTYANSISTPNCNATNGGCSSFTPNIT